MNTNEPITLSRDCEVVQIPEGTKVVLPEGSRVRVLQSLGGMFTVSTEWGNLVRIDGKDADAIGDPIPAAPAEATTPASDADIGQLVWAQLKTIYDPEIPVNIVDLGLVNECSITKTPEGGYTVDVKMALTAPGCGMGDILKQDAEGKILSIPGVKSASVEVVLDPPWDQSRMSDAAKLQLGML